jgi:hypothetical protein
MSRGTDIRRWGKEIASAVCGWADATVADGWHRVEVWNKPRRQISRAFMWNCDKKLIRIKSYCTFVVKWRQWFQAHVFIKSTISFALSINVQEKYLTLILVFKIHVLTHKLYIKWIRLWKCIRFSLNNSHPFWIWRSTIGTSLVSWLT